MIGQSDYQATTCGVRLASSETRWQSILDASSAGDVMSRCDPTRRGKAAEATSGVAEPSSTASRSSAPARESGNQAIGQSNHRPIEQSRNWAINRVPPPARERARARLQGIGQSGSLAIK
eukprot:673996-Prymnesium_polylepis.1